MTPDYAQQAGEQVRLVIPKGGYRLAIERMQAASPQVEPAPPTNLNRGHRRLIGAGLALLLVAIVAGLWWANRPGLVDRSLAQLQASPLWRSAASNARPVIIVVGDYYLFGERDADGQIARLVREFDINSPGDLEKVVASQPDQRGKYVDLGLDYLPIGVGNALRR